MRIKTDVLPYGRGAGLDESAPEYKGPSKLLHVAVLSHPGDDMIPRRFDPDKGKGKRVLEARG